MIINTFGLLGQLAQTVLAGMTSACHSTAQPEKWTKPIVAPSSLCILVIVLFPSIKPVFADGRFALVIGNSDYREISRLANPANDAIAVAKQLDEFGFIRLGIDGEETKETLLNLNRRTFLKALTSLERKLETAKDVEMVFLFYAGHGMQKNNRSYLLPTDVPADDIDLAFEESIELNSLLGRLDGLADVTIAVFDACREIPQLENSLRSAGYRPGLSGNLSGLARIRGTGRSRIVAYAGAAGELVLDGEGSHSPYTAALLESFRNPQRPVEDLFQDAAFRLGQQLDGQNPEVLVQGVEPNRFYLVSESIATGIATETEDSTKPASPQDFASIDETELDLDAMREMVRQQQLEAARNRARRAEAHRIEKLQLADQQRADRERKEAEAQERVRLQNELEAQQQAAAETAEAERVIAARQTAERAANEYASNREARATAETATERAASDNAPLPSSRQTGSIRPASKPRQPATITDRDSIKARMRDQIASLQAKNQSTKRLPEQQPTTDTEFIEISDEFETNEKNLLLTTEWRRTVQSALNEAGFSVGEPDGTFGSRTRNGIAQWQKNQGRQPTGYLNHAEHILLIAELAIHDDRRKRKPLEPEMVHVPAGTFTMGSIDGEADEQPLRDVAINAFEIAMHEITFDEYGLYLRDTGIEQPDDEGWGRGNRPVINVSWADAQEYIKWLNGKTSGGYRLPSEAEWEYAARAGTASRWTFGDNLSSMKSFGNVKGYVDGHNNTAPVASYRPNNLGLFDMHGNVSEWVNDCWHDNYEGAPATSQSWTYQCTDTIRRVLRGGSWNSLAAETRSAYRRAFRYSLKLNTVGFRLARSISSSQ